VRGFYASVRFITWICALELQGRYQKEFRSSVVPRRAVRTASVSPAEAGTSQGVFMFR
jgi:hypothetical protein